jgi:hypothetical protein
MGGRKNEQKNPMAIVYVAIIIFFACLMLGIFGAFYLYFYFYCIPAGAC